MQSGLIRMLWEGGLSEWVNQNVMGRRFISRLRMLWGEGLSVGYEEEINW